MRVRKRDWPQRVYKYAIANCDIPQSMWDTARKMHDLWCNLARLHEETRKKINDETTKDERKSIWVAFTAQVDQLVAGSGLNWECGPEVRDRFEACCKRAAKDKSGGWPRVRGMTSICIPHRYTGGGVTLNKLVGKAKRFRLFNLGAGLVPGAFGIGEDSIRFKAVIHRAIPAGCVVKQVKWLGRRSVFGWKWFIAITVEYPPVSFRIKTGKSIAIDLGWRSIKSDDEIRVGYSIDSDGHHEELRLPLQYSTRNIRRYNKRFPDVAIPVNHQELSDLQARIDAAKDELKEWIAANIEPNPVGLQKMGRRGLRKLRDETDNAELRDRIAAWMDADHTRQKRYAAAADRLAQRREWLYENWASELAKKYDRIIIEGDLKVKDMIEQPGKDKADGVEVDVGLKKGLKYHQIAATAELKVAIKNAAEKHNAVLVKAGAALTTAICSACGGKIKTSGKLVLTCENGHSIDQDENACRNLFSQIDRPEWWKERLRILDLEEVKKRREKAAK